MKNRLIGITVLLLLGFVVFVCLAGFGTLIAVMFLTMHPVMIILVTVVSSCLVLLHLMTKDNKAS
jgi:biotin transporter BioY